MGLRPQGVSGSSGGSGTFDASSYNTVVAPGNIYELSKWVGYTLRHLSYSALPPNFNCLSAIAITNRLPTSLHPRDLDRQALWTVLLSPLFFAYGQLAAFDFAPGLIWVGPGEKLYVVVYDLVSNASQAANTGQWALNMLWEPYSR
jgi:hypothetical protein